MGLINPDFFLARAVDLQRKLEGPNPGCRYTTALTRTVNEDIYMRLKGYRRSQFSKIRQEIQNMYY